MNEWIRVEGMGAFEVRSKAKFLLKHTGDRLLKAKNGRQGAFDLLRPQPCPDLTSVTSYCPVPQPRRLRRGPSAASQS